MVATPQLIVARALAHVLERECRILIAGVVDDGPALSSLVSAVSPNVALVDARLAGILDLIRDSRLRSPSTAPVVLGAPERQETVSRYLDAGAAGFVSSWATIDEAAWAVVAAGLGLRIPEDTASSLVLVATSVQVLRGQPDPRLTRREAQVGTLLARGLSNDEIASRLAISHATAKHHVHAVLQKLGATRRSEVASHYRIAEIRGLADEAGDA